MEHAIELFRLLGYSHDEIAAFKPEDRLVHDLHLVGDDFSELIEALVETFGVDLGEFDERRHSPPEISDESYYLASKESWDKWFPGLYDKIWPGFLERLLLKYKPISIDDLNQAIANRKWHFN